MSETKKRPIPAIVAGLCLLAVAVFGLVQWQKTRAIREAVENFMANTPPGLTLKAESVEPSFFGSDIVLNKVSATYESAGAEKADYHVDTLTVTGVNAAAFRDGAGVRPWCEALSLQGVRWHYSDATSMSMTMDVDVYIVEKISGDFPLIWNETATHGAELMRLAAVDAGAPPLSEEARAMLGRLSGMIRAWETFGVERLAINGLRAKGDMLGNPLVFEAGEYEVKGYSLREIGPFGISGISGQLGAGSFEAQRVSCAGVELPSYADMFVQMAEGTTPDSPLDFFAKQPLDIKKFHVEGIIFNFPNWKTPFSLKDAEFSLQFSELIGLSLDLGSVEAPKSIFLDKNDTLEPFEQQAFDLLPEMLSIDWGLSVSARVDGKAFAMDMDLNKAALSAKDVGNFSVSLAMEKIPLIQVLQGEAPQGLIKYVEVSLTDIKILDIAFLLTSDGTGQDETLDTGALREQYARMAESNAGLYPDEARKKLCVDAARLLRQPGGTLKVRLEPKEPMPMQALTMLVQTDPSQFSLSSSFVPGQ